MLRYGVTIFLSAFLLFEVQLILAKRILPWSRGASVPDRATPAASRADRGFARVAGSALERVGQPDTAGRRLETTGQRLAGVAHPGTARRQRRVAVFPARRHQSAAPGVVQPRASRHAAAAGVRALPP